MPIKTYEAEEKAVPNVKFNKYMYSYLSSYSYKHLKNFRNQTDFSCA